MSPLHLANKSASRNIWHRYHRLRLICEKFVDCLFSSRPIKAGVIMDNENSTVDQARIEVFERRDDGAVEVTVDMNDTVFAIGRKLICRSRKMPLDELDVVGPDESTDAV